MTAQDAFAIAFDNEVWAMDAMPGMGLNMKTPKPAGSGLPKSPGAAKGMGDQTSMGGTEMMTLAEHDEKNHKGGYKGGRCSWRDKHGMSGMTLEEAMSKGLANKKFPAGNDETPSDSQPQQVQTIPQDNQPQTLQQVNPEMQEAEARQIAEQGPAAVVQKLENQTSADLLAQPRDIQTDEGTIRTENIGQLAAVIFNEMQIAKGNPLGKKADAQLVQAQENGTITTGESVPSNASVEQPQQSTEERMPSSDGSYVYTLSPEESAIIKANPEKKEVLQKFIDASGKYADTTDAVEQKELLNGIKMLRQMFYGQKNPSQTQAEVASGAEKASGEESKEKETVKALQFVATDDKGNKVTGNIEADSRRDAITKLMKKGLKPISLSNEPFDVKRDDLSPSTPPSSDGSGQTPTKLCPKCSTPLRKDGSCPKEDEPWHNMDFTPVEPPAPPPDDGTGGEGESTEGSEPPSNPPTSPDQPSDESTTPPEGGYRDRSYPDELPHAPSDEEFRVGKNKYNVGGITYTDVSGKGLFRSALAAFMAGLRGEGIITEWDRINGTWDAMKRSEKGEMVRDGIASALCRDTISNYANKDGLSDDAKMEIAVIQDMMNQADSPDAQMKAIKQFQAWKEKYEKELGEQKTVSGTGGFSGLAQKGTNWKAPPTSIFPPVSKDERDTSYMDEKRKQIEERIGAIAEIVDSINGSSIVQFKVRRFADGTDKMLQNALKEMQADISAQISYSPDISGVGERMGTITINNPNVKDASLQRLLEDQKSLSTARKMEVPLLMGETAEGKALWVDLKDHGFLGGDSGSGKSERVIGAVSGAYSVKSPSELQVVFNAHANDADYDGFTDDPHTGGIGRTVEEVAQNLANANDEWKRRQKLFAEVGARNIADYNKKMEEAGTPEKKLPSILVITDEVTDLLAQSPELADEIDAIVRNGRKFGVAHLGITQDMGADNMPSRIKGATRMGVQSASATASKKIFDLHAPELANLNRKGDIMVKDSSGKLVRLRGTYADAATREKLREYNTGKITATDTPEKSLPKEYTDGIAQAVKNKQPVSVQAIEGMEEVFKKSLPNGWTVENEKVDGEDYWKAVPPKPTRVDLKDAKKAKKITKVDDVDATVDWDDVNSIKEYVKRLSDAAKEVGKGFKGNQLKERTKAMAPFTEQIEELNRYIGENFPDSDLEDGDEVQSPDDNGNGEYGGQSSSEQANQEEPQWESPLAKALKPENRIAGAQKRYEDAAKELQKRIGAKNNGITTQQFNAELKKLDEEYNDYISQVKAGKSDDEIYSAMEESHKKEEAQKKAELAKKKSLVRTTAIKNPNRKIVGATNITESYGGNPENIVPMPKGTLSKVDLPDGFELDTDINGKPVMAPAADGKMYGYARHPDGSWGRIDTNGVFHQQVNTSSKDILGEEHKETQKARDRWLKNKDNNKEEQLRKDYFRKAWGVDTRDEAPDNRTIVANAVMEALKLVEG